MRGGRRVLSRPWSVCSDRTLQAPGNPLEATVSPMYLEGGMLLKIESVSRTVSLTELVSTRAH